MFTLLFIIHITNFMNIILCVCVPLKLSHDFLRDCNTQLGDTDPEQRLSTQQLSNTIGSEDKIPCLFLLPVLQTRTEREIYLLVTPGTAQARICRLLPQSCM